MVLLLLLGSAWPAHAAKTLSVEQMEQLLATLQGKPDGKAAGELGEVQMTERVSPARLKRWEAEFPGPKTRETLTQLADMSAFLDPPASDVVENPRPEIETQKQILRMSVQYVENTISRLPDFFATRETTHFEDTLSRQASFAVEGGPTGTAPRGMSGGAAGPSETSVSEPLGALSLAPAGVATSTVFTALHSTGAYSRSVSYRGGHEVQGEDAGKPESEPALGLTSHGEFGPILAQILVDALRGQIGFARWEQGAKGPEAVFHYTVTADASHFGVAITSGGQVESVHPGYHGEIALDPGTGAILRFTEVADMMPPYQAMRAAIAVEYAPVEIAGQSYICPASAVAFSKIPVPTPGAKDPSTWPIQSELNDVAFLQYHEFRSEARLVASADEGGLNYPAGGNGSATPESSAGGAAPGPSSTASAGSAQPAAGEAASTPAPAAPMANGAAPGAPTATGAAGPSLGSAAPAAETAVAPASNPLVKPETESAATASPAPQASTAANTPAAGPMFHAQSRLVLVDVVVTDHDKPEKGLDRSRFHVFEDGHELPIASFEENQPPPSVELAEPPALPANTYSNLPVYPQTGAVNVLLLDALNTPMSDQAQLRRQMIQYLSTIKPGTAMAVFTLSSQLRMAAGFTTDIEKLRQALDNRKSIGRSNGEVGADSSEGISSNLTQAASAMANNNDPETLWLVNTIMDFAADTKTYENDQRVLMTLDGMSQLARYLAAVPGRKNVIWFSGSFPIGLAPDALASTELKNVRDYSDQVRKTSDLLSAARVSVYPVDARGVLTQRTADVTYVPPPIGGRQNRSVAVANDNTSFAEQNSLEQASMNTIATETGGHVFSTGNDLGAAIQKITANDAYYYALSYVPPEAKTGRNGADFHSIEVKVDGGKYQLAYRRGYYAQEANKAANAPGKETSPMSAAALAGAPPATQILFQARVLPEGAPELHDAALEDKVAGEKTASFPGGAHRYVVDLSVRADGLTFVKGDNGVEHTELDCELVAYDEKRQMVNSLGRGYSLKLSPEQYQRVMAAGGVIPVRLAMDLPGGAIGLRIVVFDTASARTGSLEIPVAVAAKPAGSQASAGPQ
jgi:VWFA-related protein